MADEPDALTRFPPPVKMLDYPVLTGIAVETVAVTILILVAHRFDPSHGPFTIALMVVVAFTGLVIYVSLFNIPQDEETATIIGALATAFGAVVAFWLKRD